MIQESNKSEVLNTIKKINQLSNVSDRIQKAIELKEKIYKEINDEIDELFSNLNLKK